MRKLGSIRVFRLFEIREVTEEERYGRPLSHWKPYFLSYLDRDYGTMGIVTYEADRHSLPGSHCHRVDLKTGYVESLGADDDLNDDVRRSLKLNLLRNIIFSGASPPIHDQHTPKGYREGLLRSDHE